MLFAHSRNVASGQDELNELVQAVKDSSASFGVTVQPSSSRPRTSWLPFGKRKPEIFLTAGQAIPDLQAKGAQAKYVHILDECLGRNCTQQVDMQNGQVMRYFIFADLANGPNRSP